MYAPQAEVADFAPIFASNCLLGIPRLPCLAPDGVCDPWLQQMSSELNIHTTLASGGSGLETNKIHRDCQGANLGLSKQRYFPKSLQAAGVLRLHGQCNSCRNRAVQLCRLLAEDIHCSFCKTASQGASVAGGGKVAFVAMICSHNHDFLTIIITLITLICIDIYILYSLKSQVVMNVSHSDDVPPRAQRPACAETW